MNALSKIIAARGAIVAGSDMAGGEFLKHCAKNITKNIDLVVINGAIDDANPELVHARKLGIPVMGRDELLAEVESGFKHRIAICGTHGKSTTTAMIAQIFIIAGLSPTVHCGAVMNIDGEKTSYVLGKGNIFITEACEFKRAFLKLNPTVAVITNIDADHLDCYHDIYEIRDVFRDFAQKAKTVIEHNDADPDDIKLSIAGRHNIENAALAIRVALHFGIPMSVIEKALLDFRGIDRRFEKIAAPWEETDLITDFAHHPTEITACINTATELYGLGNFLVVFQPHTYTRTVALFGDFCRVLGRYDTVLYKTYAARETEISGGTARDIATAIGAPYFDNAEALRTYITENHAKYGAILLVGAGDIYRLFAN